MKPGGTMALWHRASLKQTKKPSGYSTPGMAQLVEDPHPTNQIKSLSPIDVKSKESFLLLLVGLTFILFTPL